MVPLLFIVCKLLFDLRFLALDSQQSQAKLPYFIACILCCIELHFLESKCFYALAASGALFSVVAGGLNLEDFQLYSTRQ
ncbi:alternative cyclin pcl12 [Moniliophthora roreri]|nr:alternative cyclin pcl12 [Moniliophthora roreri]